MESAASFLQQHLPGLFKLPEGIMIKGTLHWANVTDHPHLFVGVSGSGHTMTFDDAAGGHAPNPMEAVALALGGCTAFDVITILRKKRQHVTGYVVKVEGEQKMGPPAVFSALRVHHVLRGHHIDPEAVRQAIELSHRKYCPVGAMLEQTAPIGTSFEILEEQAPSAVPSEVLRTAD
jgi:putative redox protein